jgi:hypothetical protein
MRRMRGRLAGLLAVGLLLAGVAWAAPATVSWKDHSDNETAFYVERKTDKCTGGLPFSQIGTTPANVTTFVDTSFAEGVTYCYRVAGSYVGWGKLYSETVEFMRPLAQSPGIPAAPPHPAVTSGS